MCAVPSFASLQNIEYDAQHGAHHDHGVQTYESAFEKVTQRHGASQTVVVGVTDDETGQNEEKVDGQVSVVDDNDRSAARSKGKTFENVVEYDQQGCNSAQTVQELIVGLGICVGK